MEEEMKRAARAGGIDAFYRVIEREPLILNDIDEKKFVETPLHTAASAGCTNFAIEMLSLWPSFGSKLDPQGYSPLDLALREGHRDTVKQLIMFDPKLIQVRSRERKTPLHYVAEIDDDDLLSEFLVACPTAIKELTIQRETAVHLSVINRSIQAFRVLIGWLYRTGNKKILDWKDNNGSTVLHIAAQTGQVEVVKILTKERVDLDVRNHENKTALDIVADRIADLDVVSSATPISSQRSSQNHSALCVASNQEYVKIQEILHRAGAMKTSEFRKPFTMMEILTMPRKGWPVQFFAEFDVDSRKGITEDMRNAYLIVTVLIVTASFQAILSPPGGGWERDNNNNNNNTALFIMPPPPPNTTMNYSKSSTQNGHHRSFTKEPFFYPFVVVNSITFALSVAMTIILLPYAEGSGLLIWSLVFLMATYSMSVMLISPPNPNWFITAACTFAAQLAFHVFFSFFEDYTRRTCSKVDTNSLCSQVYSSVICSRYFSISDGKASASRQIHDLSPQGLYLF